MLECLICFNLIYDYIDMILLHDIFPTAGTVLVSHYDGDGDGDEDEDEDDGGGTHLPFQDPAQPHHCHHLLR